jgi:thiosulfate/3-mercaptopyruvate sulfurtransferase
MTPESRVVIYDDMGGLAAARTYVALDYLGLGDQAALLDGHWQKWKRENRETATEVPEERNGDFIPTLRPEMLITLQPMQDLVWNKTAHPQAEVFFIDARPPEEYSGEKPGEGIERGGHIPGADNLFWMKNLESQENPVMKSVAELRRLYNYPTGSTLVAYCRTGGQAAHAYFTLKYLGYLPKIYDGSYFEWSHAKDTEVEK